MSKIQIQVLSCDSSENSAALVISTESIRILVNAGEGIQRLCVEHKVKLAKLEAICVTNLLPQRISGIPGLCLTTCDIGKSSMKIIGPSGIVNFWESTQFFMYRSKFQMDVIDSFPDKSQIIEYTDLTMQTIPLESSSSNKCSVSYLFNTPEVSGKFDVIRAKALNIPMGPLYGQLKNGKSITLDDGTIIEPHQVLGDSEKSKYFAVICSIDEDDHVLLDNLLNCNFLNSFCNHESEAFSLTSIFHLSGRSTISSQRYQNWMKSFHDNVIHVFIGSDISHDITPYLASTAYTQKLRILFPQLFSNILTETMNIRHESYALNMISAYPQLKFNVKPTKLLGIDTTCDISDSKKFIENQLNDFMQEVKINIPTLESDLKSISDHKVDILIPKNDIPLREKPFYDFNRHNRIWFLGTGCSIPSKYRNVSGIYVELEQYQSSFLLEAGEGSWFQLIRIANHLNPKASVSNNQMIIDLSRKLKLVWISHPHADHHLGILTVITERWNYLIQYSNQSEDELQPLIVIAPIPVLSFIAQYFTCASESKHDYQKAYIPIPCNVFDPYNPDFSIHSHMVVVENIINKMGIDTIQNIRVEHCNHAFGICITFQDKFKVVYSGDTRPSLDLIHIGKDASILIHEATFDDLMSEEAKIKRHSTISEAIQVGQAMNAFRIILTHFSQRYPHIPPILAQDTMNVLYAFDFMTLTFSDLLWTPLTSSIFAKAFPMKEQVEEDIIQEVLPIEYEVPVPKKSRQI